MPEAAFDEVIHAPLRLRICSLLFAADGLAFAVVRDTLGITSAHLSKQLRILSEAGYVSSSRGDSPDRVDHRPTVWLSLTPEGRRAYRGHVDALRALLPEPGDA